ncbi:hypothetical protein L6164_016546 [Bauhinia variegata]|uniref:Uncharacterized protein n=1 Tax=Bauhinia variegata TaxID=167791 RepID=A0ACB9NP13_BAUVA|nr:hypothetical protein L6164_016546 [Bauhinia variegata]
MSSEGNDASQMDKGSSSSSLHGYHQEEAYSGQIHPNSAVSFNQGESQPLLASGPPSGIPQFFPSNSQNVIHPEQFHQEAQPLVAAGQHSGISQFFPPNSQNAIHPDQLQQFHNRGLTAPNLSGPFPYGHSPQRGSFLSNDYHFPVSNLPPEHRLSSMVQSAPQYPCTQNLLGGGTGAMQPPAPQQLPQPYPVQPSYLSPAYHAWQQDPIAASGFLAPQEIQFQGVLDRSTIGQSSNQLPYQNFQQMGSYLPENSIPSAEPQLGAWVDPTLPPRYGP